MTRPLRWQSALFLLASLGASALALGGLRFDPRTELLVSTVLIGLLGIPHGAIDPLLAAAVYDLRRPTDWCWFGASYVAVALAVVLVWLFAPMLFLAGFLLVSIVHFSEDLAPGVSWVSRVAYGASVVVLPTVRYASETGRLLGLVAGADAAAPVVAVLAAVAGPLMAVAIWRALVEGVRNTQVGLELAAVVLLSVCAPPLISFTVFFCVMHSLRHLIRAAQTQADRPGRSLVYAAAWPMAGTVGAAVLGWALLGSQSLDPAMMQLVFVGLAALTVPHMVLVEAATRAGWPRMAPAFEQA
jgi:Brp/Blh family beta-carotene 15,15'-monooxygenase